MNNLNYILNQFTPITLKEMDNSVKLMDRTDTKYTFHVDELGEVLKAAQKHYKALDIETHRISRYKTLYYDTADFALYNKHHSGKLNRYKIRHRTYVESKLGFLEVKFKNNKGRTIKTRIKEFDIPDLNANAANHFLQKSLPFNPSTLVPKIWINYSRITLVNKASAERVTIDVNLEFQSAQQSKNLNHLVIAEVKQDSKIASPFVSIMRERKIREGSISKYCFGIASIFDGIKKNNFKEKLLNLEKIQNYDLITTGQ